MQNSTKIDEVYHCMTSTVSAKDRLKNLHRIASPREYRQYFDKIFDFAERCLCKILGVQQAKWPIGFSFSLTNKDAYI